MGNGADAGMMEPVHGLVLAGGASRRMGGGDKGLRLMDGRPMLARVIERLGPQCAGLVLSANGDPARFAWTGLPVVADTVPGRAGPLAGLLAGLDRLAGTAPDARWVVTATADAPFLPRDLVARLAVARRNGGAEVACAASGPRLHGAMALWPAEVREPLRAFLVAEGLRKVELFLSRYRTARVTWPDRPLDPFFNVNTPDEFAEAERLARSVGDGDL